MDEWFEPREATCLGGPLDGHVAASRYPKGFLLCDRVHAECWLYDWDATTDQYVCRDNLPRPLHDAGPDNRWRAAEEGDYDVLAAPWIGEVL